MAEIKVLLAGTHEKINNVMHANSTVSLIKSEGKLILVDAGSFGDRKKLIEALEKEGIKPSDIHVVIVTHTHLDHTTNLDLFENAKIYTKPSPQSKGAVFHGNSNEIDRANMDNFEITKDVKTILTPGHLEAHISVCVKTEKGVYVICGDAIQKEEYVSDENKPRKVWNWDEYEKSRKKILTMADYVIPGHGGVVKVPK